MMLFMTITLRTESSFVLSGKALKASHEGWLMSSSSTSRCRYSLIA